MVRAGVVKNLREWEYSGYREIHKPPSRYGIIDLLELNALFGFAGAAQFRKSIANGLNRHLLKPSSERIGGRKRSLSGSLAFVENVKSELDSKALHCAFWSLSNHQVSQNSIFKG